MGKGSVNLMIIIIRLECIFKDGILDIKFDTGETLKIWNPNNSFLTTMS